METETTSGSRKRKPEPIDEPEPKRQNIEQFSKFNVLPNEMRRHALTYCSQQSLFNYSQCSKMCNSEIQHFNTISPRILDLIDESDGILVKFTGHEMDVSKWAKKMGEKKIFSSDKNIMDDVIKYLKVFLKYSKIGEISIIRINMRRWPREILKIKKIEKIKKWTVIIHRSMFNDCLEFAKSNYGNLNSLHFEKGEEIDIIPREFFKDDAIKSLRQLSTTRCEIDDDDFLAYWPFKFHIKCSMSFELIREKVLRYNFMGVSHTRLIRISLPDDDDSIFDLNVLFPQAMFPSARYLPGNYVDFGIAIAYFPSDGKSFYVHRRDVE